MVVSLYKITLNIENQCGYGEAVDSPYLFFNLKDISPLDIGSDVMNHTVCVRSCPPDSEFAFTKDDCTPNKRYGE